MEIKSKFVKSDVLTIEVPKKCKYISKCSCNIVLKKFSQRIMEIKGSTSNRKSISARNSSYDANPDSNR